MLPFEPFKLLKLYSQVKYSATLVYLTELASWHRYFNLSCREVFEILKSLLCGFKATEDIID